MSIKQKLAQFFQPAEPKCSFAHAAGMYPYLHERDGEVTRFHLRVDDSGGGLLIANATLAAKLTQTGVLIAQKILDGNSDENIANELQQLFSQADRAAIAADIQAVKNIIEQLDRPGDNYPILNLDDTPGNSCPPSPPLSADLPLTDLEIMLPLLKRLWTQGIPHVTLIGDDKFDTSGLVQVIERAEDLGMITGLRCCGPLLLEADLIDRVSQVGLDHLNLLTLGPTQNENGLQNADYAQTIQAFEQIRMREVCTVAEIPLTAQTLDNFEEILETLAEKQVTNIAVYAIACDNSQQGDALTPDDLIQAADALEESTAETSARYLWYPPVEYINQKSLSEQILAWPRCSGDHAIRVEPSGNVFVARGKWQSIGNILSEDWQRLQQHELYQKYVQRIESDTTCEQCPGLAICGADCPRDPQGWAEAPSPVKPSKSGATT